MKFAEKVALAVSLKDDLVNLINPIRDLEFLSHSELHFIHIIPTVSLPALYLEHPLTFPVSEERKNIEAKVLAQLEKKSKDVLPVHFDGKVVYRCLFDQNPKERFCHYVDEIKASLVIVPTRKRRGLFESSFAQFVVKNTEANMIFLKYQSA